MRFCPNFYSKDDIITENHYMIGDENITKEEFHSLFKFKKYLNELPANYKKMYSYAYVDAVFGLFEYGRTIENKIKEFSNIFDLSVGVALKFDINIVYAFDREFIEYQNFELIYNDKYILTKSVDYKEKIRDFVENNKENDTNTSDFQNFS